MNALVAACLMLAPQANDAFESRRPEVRESMLQRGGGSKETEAAVRKALEWLAKNQQADHSWKTPEEDYKVGVTALSVLAFLGAGHAPNSKTYGDAVQRGLQFLIASQDVEGGVGPRGHKFMYSQILATLALAEAHGMSAPDSYAKPAQKAVDFLIAARNPGKGWRYSPKCGDNDTSVTGWAVLALRAAERSGLQFPKSALEGALAWFDSVTDEQGRSGYTNRGFYKGTPGPDVQFDFHDTPTAMAILGRYLIQKVRKDERLTTGLFRLALDPPKWEKNQLDYVYWHVGSLAMFEAGGNEGPRWKPWNEALQKTLLGHQSEDGSWEPQDRWSVFDPGPAYATALNALTLETYYRYVRTFRADEK